ncbi:MAG: phosphatidate cytidylyltransferase [Caldilineaceae bacterium]|nr:phosphatidate cytidylyltransferase [Caldilineaceae bacterium]
MIQGWRPDLLALTTVLTVGLIATLIYALYQTEAPASTWMSTSIGAIYLGVMIGQALALRLGDEGLWLLLLGVLITWANDTAAYFTGVTLGKRKLWPRLSPKKTWEGTLGWLDWLRGWLVGCWSGSCRSR